MIISCFTNKYNTLSVFIFWGSGSNGLLTGHAVLRSAGSCITILWIIKPYVWSIPDKMYAHIIFSPFFALLF
nr:MAG TPA: hypothetical protein [Caudoviricetes sp.]